MLISFANLTCVPRTQKKKLLHLLVRMKNIQEISFKCNQGKLGYNIYLILVH